MMQGFPVVAAAGGYSLTWCHRLLVLVVQRHHLSWSCSIFLTVSQATQGRQSRRERKKTRDTGNGRDAGKHMHEDRCNPCVVPPECPLGSQGDDSRNSVRTYCNAHVSFSPVAQDTQKTLNKCYSMFLWLKSYGSKDESQRWFWGLRSDWLSYLENTRTKVPYMNPSQ